MDNEKQFVDPTDPTDRTDRSAKKQSVKPTDQTDQTNALNLTISLALVVSTKTALCHRCIYCREAAEALKARSMIAQGKRAESARRPGYNANSGRVPRPLLPQSAQLTGAKEAMEPGNVITVLSLAPAAVFF